MKRREFITSSARAIRPQCIRCFRPCIWSSHGHLCEAIFRNRVLSAYHSRRDDQGNAFSAMSVAAFGQ